MGRRQSVEERRELGRGLRREVPRTSLGDWTPGPDRRDPVELLDEQNETRVQWLVPIRHARMRVTPFTFYRGAARIMAADLATTTRTGFDVQISGDAHLANFGAYASPERQLVFDQNDFDETLPGPWEWDLKRLATSFVVAGQHYGFDPATCRQVAGEASRAYRQGIRHFAAMGHLALWYDYVDVDDIQAGGGLSEAEFAKRIARFTRKAEQRTSQEALRKFATKVDGQWRIRDDPPVLFSLDHLPSDAPEAENTEAIWNASVTAIGAYKSTLDDNRHALVDRYELVEVGVKVVGVGSVGTRCLLFILLGRDDDDVLFLQGKEAAASVHAEFLHPSTYPNHGQRVVEGQRLVQAQSDPFLGWTESPTEGRDFYIRQLRDWKGSVDVERTDITPEQLSFYAGLCGTTLARGHARSGDAEAIAAYAGKSTTLDTAIAAFAESYAATNLDDYQRFCEAIDDGRLPCAEHV